MNPSANTVPAENKSVLDERGRVVHPVFGPEPTVGELLATWPEHKVEWCAKWIKEAAWRADPRNARIIWEYELFLTRVSGLEKTTAYSKMRDYAKTALNAQVTDAIPSIIQKLIAQAHAGDTNAARLLLDKVIANPRPEARPIRIEMPDNVDRAEALFQATVDGKISVEDGSRLLSALAQVESARAEADYRERVARLEAAVRNAGLPHQPAGPAQVIRIVRSSTPAEVVDTNADAQDNAD